LLQGGELCVGAVRGGSSVAFRTTRQSIGAAWPGVLLPSVLVSGGLGSRLLSVFGAGCGGGGWNPVILHVLVTFRPTIFGACAGRARVGRWRGPFPTVGVSWPQGLPAGVSMGWGARRSARFRTKVVIAGEMFTVAVNPQVFHGGCVGFACSRRLAGAGLSNPHGRVEPKKRFGAPARGPTGCLSALLLFWFPPLGFCCMESAPPALVW